MVQLAIQPLVATAVLQVSVNDTPVTVEGNCMQSFKTACWLFATLM